MTGNSRSDFLRSVNAQVQYWQEALSESQMTAADWWLSFGSDIRLLRDIWFGLNPDEKSQILSNTPVATVAPVDLLDFLVEETRATQHYAISSIQNKLAALVESFDAGSAWVFLNHGSILVLRASANGACRETGTTYLHIDQDPSIVCHVFRTQEGYLTNCVDDEPRYLKWIPDSGSEIAVPLLLDGMVIGVLNIESPRRDAFIEPHLAQLSAEAKVLMVDIYVLRKCEIQASDPRHPELVSDFCAWHPERRGWDCTRFYSDICEKVSTSLASATGRPMREHYAEPAVTYWSLDRSLDSLYALGTFGFNTEYVTSSILPSRRSRTGETVNGSEIRRFSGNELSRSAKAQNQRVSEAFMAPLISKRTEAIGALNVYFRAQPSRSMVHELLTNASSLLVDIIEDQITLRSTLAILEIEAVAASDQLFSHDPFGVLLNVILRIFSADEGSVFLRVDNELVCVATTGLVGDLGITIGPGDVCYDMQLPSDRGWTTHLASSCGRSLRFNDVSATTFAGDFRNRAKVRERAAIGDPHIRFCGASIGEHCAESQTIPYGVIRLVRRSNSPPFVELDERLLLSIANCVSSVFQNFLSVRQRRRPNAACTAYHHSLRNQLHAPVTQLRSLLSGVVQLFRRTRQTFQATIRVVTHSPRGQGLLTFASYSALHSGIAEELESRFHLINGDGPRSIGWESIKRDRILWFNKTRAAMCNWFVPINVDSTESVTDGVCVPFQWVDGKARLCLGVFSIDSRSSSSVSQSSWKAEDFSVLEETAKQAAMVLGCRPPQSGVRGLSRSSDYDLQQFVLSVCKDLRADWYSLTMRQGVVFPSKDVYPGCAQEISDWETRVIEISPGFKQEFEIGNGGRACRIRLRSICADACELSVGNGSAKFQSSFVNSLPQVTASWNAISYLLNPEWESKWQFSAESDGIVEVSDVSHAWRSDFLDRLQFAMVPWMSKK